MVSSLCQVQFIARPKDFEGVSYNFNLNVETRIDEVRKLIVSVVKVDISELGKGNILASISVGTGIEIVDFENVIKAAKGDKISLPPQLDVIIKTLAISTTRGVLYSELRGTYLHKAFMPIIFQQGKIEEIEKSTK